MKNYNVCIFNRNFDKFSVQRLDNLEKRVDKIEQRLDVLEQDVKEIKVRVSKIESCPTIQKELSLVQ